MEKAFFKNRPFSNIRHIVITLLILISTTLVANVSCNLGIILEITGGVAATFLAFMVPCACWLRSNQLAGQQLNVWAKVKHGAVIGFGVVVMIVTLVTVAIDTVNKSSGHDEGSADKCNW